MKSQIASLMLIAAAGCLAVGSARVYDEMRVEDF
jgi:hypothetical protein